MSHNGTWKCKICASWAKASHLFEYFFGSHLNLADKGDSILIAVILPIQSLIVSAEVSICLCALSRGREKQIPVQQNFLSSVSMEEEITFVCFPTPSM